MPKEINTEHGRTKLILEPVAGIFLPRVAFEEANQAPGLPDGLFSNQKIQILVYFGGPRNGKCCYIS
jgi:hypothetical protein